MKTLRTANYASGFTLIELLIAIAIIGILAAVIVPTYHASVRKANEAAAVTAVNTIKVAQARYVINHDGHYGSFGELFRGAILTGDSIRSHHTSVVMCL
jgi:type IV pilus assembly protein PilE